MDRIYLSRRNLLALLSKLDRQAKGEATACTLIKFNNSGDYPQTMDECLVTAVEDCVYYSDRKPGIIHPKDVPA